MKRVWWAWTLGALLAVGCGISAPAKKELQDQSAVGQARLRRWDDLSAPQRKQAYREAVQGFVDLDFSICGTPIPDGFAAVTTKVGP